MAIQTVNLGTAPSGAGGDTFRSTGAKINENFTNPTHAASRFVGTAAGDVMEIGAFGFGGSGFVYPNISNLVEMKAATQARSRIIRAEDGGVLVPYAPSLFLKTQDTNVVISIGALAGDVRVVGWTDGASIFTAQYFLRTSSNTTVDSNGFIKAASPIVQLFADKITANDEAQQQEIIFEKLSIGDYLIRGTTGFALEGWYVETPKDANGNVLFSVIYDTLENGDISVKTYEKKFDLETASIVADIDKPIDITTGRWIDLRLQELPQPEIKIPESATPPDFQPTGLARAVAAAMESYNDPK